MGFHWEEHWYQNLVNWRTFENCKFDLKSVFSTIICCLHQRDFGFIINLFLLGLYVEFSYKLDITDIAHSLQTPWTQPPWRQPAIWTWKTNKTKQTCHSYKQIKWNSISRQNFKSLVSSCATCISANYLLYTEKLQSTLLSFSLFTQMLIRFP